MVWWKKVIEFLFFLTFIYPLFRLTLQQLIKNLGDQLNLDSDVLDQLDLDSFIGNAIKVEAGELPSLRV